MKITDPQVIEDGEKDLITAVQEDLDLDAVKQILKDRMGASTLSSKGGEIVVHNNKIAFRLDFDINLSGSLLFDREGNYIDDSGEEKLLEPSGDQENEISIGLPEYDLEDEPLETQDLESMAESNQVDTRNLENKSLENESLEDNDLADEAVLQEEMLDDDINGILKESREFWEQKKDS